MKTYIRVMIPLFILIYSGTGCKSDKKTDVTIKTDTLNAPQTLDSVNSGIKKFDVKSGVAEYEVFDKSAPGKPAARHTRYFDDYGRKYRREGDQSLYLELNGYAYSINLADSQGIRFRVNVTDAFNPDYTDFSSLSPEIKRKHNYKSEGYETIMEKKCEVITMDYKDMKMKVKYWLYEFIPLKIRVESQFIKSEIVCTDLKEINVLADKFVLPKWMKITGTN